MKKSVKTMKGSQLLSTTELSVTYPELYDFLLCLQDYEKHYYTVSGNVIRKYQWIDSPHERGKSLTWVNLANDYPELRERIKGL